MAIDERDREMIARVAYAVAKAQGLGDFKAAAAGGNALLGLRDFERIRAALMDPKSQAREEDRAAVRVFLEAIGVAG